MEKGRDYVCKPMEPYCSCYLLADEPSEDCMIHGFAINNRCQCGRFVRRPQVHSVQQE